MLIFFTPSFRAVVIALVCAFLFFNRTPAPAQLTQTHAGGVVAPAGGCVAAAAIIGRAQSAGGSPNVSAYGTLICGLVTDDVFANSATVPCGSLFDVFYVMATDSTQSASIDFCNGGNNLTNNNGAPTFTANTGYTGVDAQVNGPTLLPGTWSPFGGTNFTLNAAHLAAWTMTNFASNDGAMGAVLGGCTPCTVMTPNYAADSNKFSADINDNVRVGVTVASGQGFFVANRTSSSNVDLYYNGASAASENQTTTSVPNQVFILLGHRGGANTNGWGGTMAMMSGGGTLTSGQISSMNTRICAFLTTVHGSC